MAKGNVSSSNATEKEARVARELLHQFENLSVEVRSLLIERASSSDVLTHLADGIQHSLDALQGRASAADLRRAATSVRAQTSHGVRMLLELEAFAGRLDGLAWARDAFEQAEGFAE
ncbi:MAG: hypothetical protein K0R38_5354 [Polyangiaceae bacterium]|jgi:hypothetical protein|nr:hypothetical protein [Polyangiaceae bacterium]